MNRRAMRRVSVMTHVINREDWADDLEYWRGELQGGTYGANISMIFSRLAETSGGPRLHQHPYPEIFIIRSGEALFTVGREEIRADAGQIVIVPPNTPHKFTNAGSTPLETIDIHESGKFITEWLE
jgi:mannose-6-phosphate isomerase-like protein (cupin superfamily)